ncbi:MAG: ornithine carbamoyltransferase [Chloroflexi bacterium]|nr:ornithine carbamoyltransferase [Chloroflexota bacterium]
MKGKDLISVADLDVGDVRRLLERAQAMKMGEEGGAPLTGRTLALLFEKPSLRTRVSFDVAMYQLGGHAIYLSDAEVGLGRREPIADVARTIGRYVDGITARTFAQATVEELARHATIPVINALSDAEHPCQALGDLLTIYEKKGRLTGLTLAFVGDGNNVAHSLMLACALAGMHFRIASPHGYLVGDDFRRKAKALATASGGSILCTKDPVAAVRGADVVYTDVWTSMGQEAEAVERRRVFTPYQVTQELLSQAGPEAILMHPLPAHPGEELAPGLIDSPQSVVFDQAENRLHIQKAILAELLGR